ncbi:hypothetical protein M434DRAFT_397138 [Hypoxylon sp. CO27-5]|nr:hypothetical protein M434DRAFT_397138 [Hypoxylon sp. CO27-5]
MSATETSPNDRTPEHETTTVAVDKEHGNSHKRKASSPSLDDDKHSQSPKRSRLDVDSKEDSAVAKALPTQRESTTDRRESALQEEKRRGKRLFGGLLSTLSQTTSSSQQKRRQEIERRQQAKVHQQKAEDDKHREEKLAKLRTVRKMEQLKFDERVMQTKHSNMLATARFLETKSAPKIYYLPWDPTVEQEDIIKDQIRKAEDIINKEVLDFKRHKEQTMKALGITVESPTLESEDTVGSKLDDEHLTDIPQSNPANRPPSHTGKVGHEKESDRADDVMIEEVEDTVIY